MRLAIKFETKNSELPIEYRRMLLSVLKKSFEVSSKEVYEAFYKNRDPNLKPFTFAVYLPNPKFDKHSITLGSNEFTLNFSTADYKTGILFYNGLLKNKKTGFSYHYKENDTTYQVDLKSVQLNKNEKKSFDNEVVFKTLSPFVVRKHNPEDNKDIYLKPEDSDFYKILSENTRLKVKEFLNIDEDLKIEPIKLKKIPVKHYNRFVEGLHGIVKISGSEKVLDLIYKIGLGANNGYGFGMLEVVYGGK